MAIVFSSAEAALLVQAMPSRAKLKAVHFIASLPEVGGAAYLRRPLSCDNLTLFVSIVAYAGTGCVLVLTCHSSTPRPMIRPGTNV
jgi:hypothetical protein